jgi:predicted SnoaL-like aldol condensation-catalyzing enzyme
MSESLKERAISFLREIVAGDVKGAYDRHVGDGFRHHNAYFPGDAASLRAGMEDDEQRNPGKTLHVVNALEDGDRVAVHSRLCRPGGQPDIAVVHLFRFDGGAIVEMWDVAMLAPETIVNQHGLF